MNTENRVLLPMKSFKIIPREICEYGKWKPEVYEEPDSQTIPSPSTGKSAPISTLQSNPFKKAKVSIESEPQVPSSADKKLIDVMELVTPFIDIILDELKKYNAALSSTNVLLGTISNMLHSMSSIDKELFEALRSITASNDQNIAEKRIETILLQINRFVDRVSTKLHRSSSADKEQLVLKSLTASVEKILADQREAKDLFVENKVLLGKIFSQLKCLQTIESIIETTWLTDIVKCLKFE